MIVALVPHLVHPLRLLLEIDLQGLDQVKTVDLPRCHQDPWMIVGLQFLAVLLHLLGVPYLPYLVQLMIVAHQGPLLLLTTVADHCHPCLVRIGTRHQGPLQYLYLLLWISHLHARLIVRDQKFILKFLLKIDSVDFLVCKKG